MERRRKARNLAMAAKINLLLAAWLEQELQDVDKASVPTGNLFNDLCAAPTVLGLAETRPGGGEGPMAGIVSAQIEAQSGGYINAFGQACASLLFARRSYLVVPKRKRFEELMHLHALCARFGLGLVIFDPFSNVHPGFRLAIPAVDHDPDPAYASRCIKQLEVAFPPERSAK